jgi:FkbM family methyltransferase
MKWNKIPDFLWPLVIRYYGSRIIGIQPSTVTSNWVYFLRLALPLRITIRKQNNLYHVYNPTLGHTAIMRPASSDVLVYLQIFFNHEYASLNTLLLLENPVVVDLGANAGFFMLWVKARWPAAHILCVEPDADNYQITEWQLAINKISNVNAQRAGVWVRNELLKITPHTNGLEWSHRVQNDAHGDVPGITFDKLLANGDIQKVDLLKIDIEGTEELLFEDATFLKTLSARVVHVILETHHPEKQITIAATLRGLNFEVTLDRELIFAKQTGL